LVVSSAYWEGFAKAGLGKLTVGVKSVRVAVWVVSPRLAPSPALSILAPRLARLFVRLLPVTVTVPL
jgi:hypothetical protein